MENPPRLEKSIFPKEGIPGDRHTSRHNQYEVDVYKLIHLTEAVPETTASVTDFEYILNEAQWSDENGKVVSPQDVINVCQAAGSFEGASAVHPELSKHLLKIKNADISFPVIIFESRILDGVHRLVKAIMDGQSAIPAKILEQIPADAVIKMHEAEE